MSEFNFRSGAEAAEQAAHRTSFNRLGFFSLKEGESAFVRMLSGHEEGKGFITVAQHGNSPTRDAPKDFKGNWPAKMSATCRNDPAFGDTYEDCWLCEQWKKTGDDRSFKPGTRCWALGVIRVPKMVDGRQVGMVDATVEIERDDKKIIVPEVVLMNFAWNNFFVNMANTYSMNGTWCDRDHYIQRKGTGTDTDYPISAQQPCAEDGTPYDIALAKHEANPEAFPHPGVVFDTRIAAHAGPYLYALGVTPEDLATKYGNDPQRAFQAEISKVVVDRSSNEYYARFFDTRMEQPSNKPKEDGGVAQANGATPPPVASAPQPNNDELAELAARVQGMSGYGTVAPEPATSAPA